MINNTTLTGRLTSDLELKRTNNGTAVVNFTLAVQRTFKNANGEQESDFIRCIAWRKTAEIMEQYLNKGALIGITGAIRTGRYQDNDGKTVYTTDVEVADFTFLESKKQQQQNNSRPTYNTQQQAQPDNPFADSDITDIKDDDLPF